VTILGRRDALRLVVAPLALAAVGRRPRPAAPLRVLVVGGHPDDPESGCGGTIARYAEAGHAVAVLYLTRGEAGIEGRTHDEAARVRTAEAERACAALGASPRFAGQVDGDSRVDAAAYDAVRALFDELRPDVVLTQWPVDTHRDHRAASLLAYDAWLRAGRRAALGYYEVLTGDQTQLFRPTDYVDITSVARRKRDAVFAHASQKPEEWYPAHERMARFRGMEHRCELAEAFVRHDAGPALPLPP
jgi:LmbE family N-acetylglucosaminyl deacetylase